MRQIPQANSIRQNDEQVFFRIASSSIALAFGGLLASVQALTPDASGFSLHANWGTLAAFVIGGAFGLLCWKLGAITSTATRRMVLLFRTAIILILISGLAAFLYPLRFLPSDKLPEIWIGLATAATALSTIGFMLYRIHRFLENDTKQHAVEFSLSREVGNRQEMGANFA